MFINNEHTLSISQSTSTDHYAEIDIIHTLYNNFTLFIHYSDCARDRAIKYAKNGEFFDYILINKSNIILLTKSSHSLLTK